MKRRGFTLIELLAVVAIIVALLAILLPSMGKAVEAANRAVCASQLHQVGGAFLMYASDHYGALPPGNATISPVHGTPSIRLPGLNLVFGQGFLMTESYLPTAEALYCPTWSHPAFQYDHIDTAGVDPFGGPNSRGGWPAPGNPGANNVWGDSYFYRSSFIGDDGLADDPPHLQRTPSGSTIMADHWVMREDYLGHLYGHGEYSSALRLDLSVGHAILPRADLEAMWPWGPAGSGAHANSSWTEHELWVWQPYFDRQ